MTRHSLPSLSLLLGLSLVSLSACQHDMGTPAVTDSVMRNSVQLVRLPHLVRPEDDGTDTPSGATYAALDAFLIGVRAGYGDTVLLDSAGANPARLNDLITHIRKRGLEFGGAAVLGATPAAGEVMVYVERHVVTTPDCGAWPDETSNNQRNNTSAYFGCSTVGNLGLMVADPRDLVTGRTSGNSTAAAVGALYTPAPGPGGPQVTVSFDGLPTTGTAPTIAPVAAPSPQN